MQVPVPLVATCVMCCIYAVIAFPRDYTDSQDADIDTKYDRELAAETDPDLRKMLLKKLRFREILRENRMSPYDVIDSIDDHHTEERHKASKRHEMNDLMSRVKAMLSNMKVRQIKESMELPSLRFGRSGLKFPMYN